MRWYRKRTTTTASKTKIKKYTIIQQAQPQNTGYWKKVSYHRGPYRKKQKKELKLHKIITWCSWCSWEKLARSPSKAG